MKSPLTATHLADMIGKLPVPLAVYRSPHARFEVFRAKDMHSHAWKNAALRELVAICRTSYSRYGKRPLFDPYDEKAAIYLVRAIRNSSHSGSREEEWLSLRMVPGDKTPIGVAEPEIHRSMGKRLDHWMKKKIGMHRFWNHVASSSRMCGIHPYILKKDGGLVFSKTSAHLYTPICFALAHKQFVIDYPLSRFPYQYITAMVRPDFYKKRLGFSSGGKTVRPVHTPAYRFLDIDRASIRVDRKIYSYPFPLYWLDNKKLLSLMNKLRRKENKAPLELLKTEMFSELTKQTTKPVSIAGIRIKPGEMRALIDRYVPDAPELKITKADRWYRGMNAVLRAAKITHQ